MQLYTHTFKAMASPCTLKFYCNDIVAAQKIFQAVEEKTRLFEKRYSRYLPFSIVSKINNANGEAIKVDEETAKLLNFATVAWKISGGLSDITSGPFRTVWDFKNGTVPTSKQIKNVLALVGWEKVKWDGETLQMPAGMQIDFGGIVKEYATDAARTLAESMGVEHGLVELGGDISVIGPHLDGSPWKIALQHPDHKDIEVVVEIGRGCVASSGDYERYFEQDGKRYCHIINPLNGQCAQGVAGVSVIAPHCVMAGTITTTALLKGPQFALDYLAETGLHHQLYLRDYTGEAVLAS